MSNSTMRTIVLSMIGSKNTMEQKLKWLAENIAVPPVIRRLSQYTFLHEGDFVHVKRVETMGYHKHRSVCCISFSILD